MSPISAPLRAPGKPPGEWLPGALNIQYRANSDYRKGIVGAAARRGRRRGAGVAQVRQGAPSTSWKRLFPRPKGCQGAKPAWGGAPKGTPLTTLWSRKFCLHEVDGAVGRRESGGAGRSSNGRVVWCISKAAPDPSPLAVRLISRSGGVSPQGWKPDGGDALAAPCACTTARPRDAARGHP